MINYKQILEAVNRGIKFALDDFDDNEQIQGQVNSKVKYKGGMNEYLDLMEEVIDLGLPSGTLWCKYNLGVDSNQLNTPEDWYGKYYVWGELEGIKTNKDGKIYFGQDYKFGYKFGNYNNLTKYCNNPKYGLKNFTDNLTKLLPEDDAAYQNKKLHNYKFHIPTKEQLEELKDNTANYWVNNYDPNKIKHNTADDGGIKGLNGGIFEGKNGNQLFIPAAGLRQDLCRYHVGLYGHLWSSSLYLKDCSRACCLSFNTSIINIYNEEHTYGYAERTYGYSVRPVINL